MNQAAQRPMLHRLTDRAMQRASEGPSLAKQLRAALRIAAAAEGVSVTPLATEYCKLSMAQLVAELASDWLVLSLQAGRGTIGLCAVDAVLAHAILQAKTGGSGPHSPQPRPYTSADCFMVVPFVTRFLSELAGVAGQDDLAAHATGADVGAMIAGAEAIHLALGDGTVDFGRISLAREGGAEGQVAFAFVAAPQVSQHDGDAARYSWAQGLQGNLLAAPTPIAGVLARIDMPLHALQGLQEGDMVALHGVSVADLRVETACGSLLGQGRLGQRGGLRAIRMAGHLVPMLSGAAVTPAIAEQVGDIMM